MSGGFHPARRGPLPDLRPQVFRGGRNSKKGNKLQDKEKGGGGKTRETDVSGGFLFFYNVFTKSTGKIHCRCEAPREEPREAHGY